jgi:hypothetical protein
MPLPVWARRGLPDSGPKAWETLSREAGNRDGSKAVCIYVHIPFCAARCGFCDCYSFRLANHREEHIDAYLSHLRTEMEACTSAAGLPPSSAGRHSYAWRPTAVRGSPPATGPNGRWRRPPPN